jgi:hypothetical protein
MSTIDPTAPRSIGLMPTERPLTIVSMYSTMQPSDVSVRPYGYSRIGIGASLKCQRESLSSCDHLMLMEFSSAIECHAALSMRF